MLWIPAALLATPALADDAPDVSAPPYTADLPLQVQDDAKWRDVDARASRMGRTGGTLTLVGGVTTLLGVGLVVAGSDNGSEAVTAAGAVVTTAGLGGMVVGPPLLLSASLRSNSALRERGVFTTALPGALGWASLGGWVFPALLTAEVDPALPITMFATGYVASVALGYGQLEANRTARSRAGLRPVAATGARRRGPMVAVLPTPRGAVLAGRF